MLFQLQAVLESLAHAFRDLVVAIFPVLILDELTFQTDGELVDDRRIHGFCLAGGQPAAGKFARHPVAGFHAEVVGLHHVGGIGNADGKGPLRLDVLHGLVGFGQIQRHNIPLLHGTQRRVHHVHTAVFVIGSDHQGGHGENALGDVQLRSHYNSSLQYRLTG